MKSLRLLIFFCDVPTGYSCPANWVVGGMYVAVAMGVGLELEGDDAVRICTSRT